MSSLTRVVCWSTLSWALLQLQVLVTSIKTPSFGRTLGPKDTRNVCYLLTVLTPRTSACDTFPYMICGYLREVVAWLPSVRTPPLSVAITTSDTPYSRSCRIITNMAHPCSFYNQFHVMTPIFITKVLFYAVEGIMLVCSVVYLYRWSAACRFLWRFQLPVYEFMTRWIFSELQPSGYLISIADQNYNIILISNVWIIKWFINIVIIGMFRLLQKRMSISLSLWRFLLNLQIEKFQSSYHLVI